MSSKSIPDAEPELIPWADNFINTVDANKDAWDIPATEVTGIQNALTAFKYLFEQARSPERTSVIVVQKNTAKKDLLDRIRAMMSFRLKNPVITAAQLKELGLNTGERTYSPKPRPTTYPSFQIVQTGARMLAIVYREGTGKKGSKPPEANGARIYYGVFDERPPSPGDLPASVFATRCPHTITFRETDRGRRAYIALKWENRKGEDGPWSEIASEIIP
ncbi:MAG: hypothetical protein LBC51_06810 [Treponema sp.]|nr:hypothetical protein [Treponema sp.]